MLLIAVTGLVGSGKTQLLEQLVFWYAREGRHVEGFLAKARGRSPGKGADAYVLKWAATGEEIPFAERHPEDTFPYRFEASTLQRIQDWAKCLSAPALIVLDEFGKLEAKGEGHMALWPFIQEAKPEIVAIAIREGTRTDLETHLGRPFDLVIQTSDPQAFTRLRSACLDQPDWARLGSFGAGSGLLELSLGSVLHGAKVPMRGLVMSSMQTALMTQAAAGLGNRGRVVWVPYIAAGLKALSPAGNRLRPMLAITVQGLAYAFAIRLLGWNHLGVAVGSFLVGAWAAGQGLLLQYLLLGKDLLKAYDIVVAWLDRTVGLSPPAIATAIAGWILLWALVTATVGLLSLSGTCLPLGKWQARLPLPPALALDEPPRWEKALALGFTDLLRPTFWAPLGLVIAILLAVGSPWESAFWAGIRAVTIGVLLFTLARVFDARGAIGWLRQHGHWGPALAFNRALDELRKPR